MPWRRSAVVAGCTFAVFSLAALPFGFATGLLTWAPTTDQLALTVAAAFLLPAFAEEAVFRRPLLTRVARQHQWSAALLGITAYTAWHPVTALALYPAALPLFARADFLLIVAGFGISSTLVVFATGRWLPAVLMHWVMVVAWKQLFGGPTLLALG